MLINYVPGEECRIAIARDGRLEEFYQERASTESHVGNIYKGRVTNVESSIQAAFIDFGLERNGFLHISDLHPMYFSGKDREEFERVGSKTPHRQRPPIQKCLQKGQEVLVQVLKEGIGTKGPTLTTYLSIPGRFLVMMPYMERLGVSRKVDDDDARRATRKILAELDPPEGFGFIVRTAGIGQTKTDLKRDLAYLQRLWKNIESRRKKIGRAGELYTESDLIIRTIRDVFSNDIDRVIVDHPTAARRAQDFLSIASPRARSRVVFYNDPVPLFHRFGIEAQIERIHDREVPLPSGGSLVIDATEALVAIDVNSGKSRDAKDAESNAYNTNKEAVDELARQLRLRDLGGVVVNDLIDMRDQKHRRQIESRLRQNFKNDRARTRVGSISQFGLLEMTRQRMRPSLQTSNYNTCHTCHGDGYVKSAESVVLDVMRRLRLTMQHQQVERIELTISPDVAFQLLNRKRAELTHLEQRYGKSVMVRVGGHSVDHLEIAAYDQRGMIDLGTLSEPKQLPAARDKAYVELEDGEVPAEAIEQAEARGEAEAAAETTAPESVANAGLSETDAYIAATSTTPVGTPDEPADTNGEDSDSDDGKRRRRRRRGGRGRRKKKQPNGDQAQSKEQTEQADQSDKPEKPEKPDKPDKPDRKKSKHRGRKKAADERPADTGETESDAQTAEHDTAAETTAQRSAEATEETEQTDASRQQADAAHSTTRGDDTGHTDTGNGEAADTETNGDTDADAEQTDVKTGSDKRKRRRRGGRGRKRGSGKRDAASDDTQPEPTDESDGTASTSDEAAPPDTQSAAQDAPSRAEDNEPAHASPAHPASDDKPASDHPAEPGHAESEQTETGPAESGHADTGDKPDKPPKKKSKPKTGGYSNRLVNVAQHDDNRS